MEHGKRQHLRRTVFWAEHDVAGGAGDVVILLYSVHIAALAAQALGCEVGAPLLNKPPAFDAAGVLV